MYRAWLLLSIPPFHLYLRLLLYLDTIIEVNQLYMPILCNVYRQKRRQTTAMQNMEQTLSELSSKVTDSNELQQSLNQAHEKSVLLENMLKERDAELARLRQLVLTRGEFDL